MKARLKMLAAMLIFGSIGLFVRQIPLESSVIVLCRSVIGSLFLGAVLLVRRQKINLPALRRQLPLLLLSGAVMGANWVCLFEAYRYTTVSAATLAYYCAPVFVLLASPLVLKEKLTWPRLAGISAAMLGMVLVGGGAWAGGTANLKGIQLGLAAAGFYAALMLLGKFVRDLSGIETTLVRLMSAAVVMVLYLAFSGVGNAVLPTGAPLAALLLLGVVHTGLACYLFFSAIETLPAQTSALLSYIDPASALVFSALFLGERMQPAQMVGALLILGGAAFGESFCAKRREPV